MLDQQRFTRGVEVRPGDLEPVMVRRLKSDLRALGEAFPERVVEPVTIAGPPDDAPELVLAQVLAAYGELRLRLRRIASLPPGQERLPVTAIWTEPGRADRRLRPLGESGQESTMAQLEDALRDARPAPPAVIARLQASLQADVADLVPRMEEIAAERLAQVAAQLAQRGEQEAGSLAALLQTQRARIASAARRFDPASSAWTSCPRSAASARRTGATGRAG